MTKLIFRASTLLFIIIFLFACKKDEVKNIPSVDPNGISLNIKHFGSSLLEMDTSDVKSGLAHLSSEYPLFFDQIYLPRILPVLQDPKIFNQFIKAPSVRNLLDTCQIISRDFEHEEMAFKDAFAFYKHYLPDARIPEIVTFTSEYTLGNFTYEDSLVGIGLDFFLGQGHSGYSLDFFPNYIQKSMSREYIVSKTMKTLATDIVGPPNGSKLIDIMVNNGKVQYILDHLLPREQDSIKLEYSQEQVEWCEANEKSIWAFLLDEELLYSTQQKEFQKYVDHSPNSPGMPDLAPGRTANYVGWKIIEAYMKRFPETTFTELLALDDAQAILTKSKYKPKR